MGELFEIKQHNLVECDGQSCDYVVKNETGNPDNPLLATFINKPCPKCGENLLTLDDYHLYRRTVRIVNSINRWFGWLGRLRKTRNHRGNNGHKLKIKQGKICWV